MNLSELLVHGTIDPIGSIRKNGPFILFLISGITALIACSVSLINGIITLIIKGKMTKIAYWMTTIHCITGICTLYAAAASLCLGFYKAEFKSWFGNDSNTIVLIVLTCIYTFLVTLDYWLTLLL